MEYRIAGSETTATTLVCMTYYIVRNPSIQDRLKTEIRTAFTRYEDIDAASANTLPYLRVVIQEAMRVFPPLPFALPRVVPVGGSTVDGHHVPGGVCNIHHSLCRIKSSQSKQTIVSTSPFAACMASANFKGPWEFKPERWLGQNVTDDLEASQPFSLGPRSCMGRR